MRWLPRLPRPPVAIWTSNGPHAKGATATSVQVFEKSGGPVATRTPDLYRVKVVRSITYEGSELKTRDLHANDLDLKWTLAGNGPWPAFWTSRGPHTRPPSVESRVLRARGRHRFFFVVVVRQHLISLSRWIPCLPPGGDCEGEQSGNWALVKKWAPLASNATRASHSERANALARFWHD